MHMAYRFNANIPYGNVAHALVTQQAGRWRVEFAAHPHGGPECLWFCFRIERIEEMLPSGQVELVLKHSQNMLGAGDPTTIRPVVRHAHGDWERLCPGAAQFFPDGRCEITWLINPPQEWVDIAFCYPYGMAELDALLAETHGYWRADTIGVSQGGRPIVRLSNSFGEPCGQRPGLYLVARQHSGETPGSWVLDGLLRYLATMGEKAPLTWAVPLTNIDGVEQGDYGKDNFPYDLNRAWGVVPMRHEVLVIQRDVGRWSERCKPVLGIDFHAPGACETDGMYCYLPKPASYPSAYRDALEWSTAINAHLSSTYAAPNFSRVVKYPSRWETPTFISFMASAVQCPGLSIETPYAMCRETVMTRERYKESGALIGAAIMELLGFV
jgi:hypothetical protein